MKTTKNFSKKTTYALLALSCLANNAYGMNKSTVYQKESKAQLRAEQLQAATEWYNNHAQQKSLQPKLTKMISSGIINDFEKDELATLQLNSALSLIQSSMRGKIARDEMLKIAKKDGKVLSCTEQGKKIVADCLEITRKIYNIYAKQFEVYAKMISKNHTTATKDEYIAWHVSYEKTLKLLHNHIVEIPQFMEETLLAANSEQQFKSKTLELFLKKPAASCESFLEETENLINTYTLI